MNRAACENLESANLKSKNCKPKLLHIASDTFQGGAERVFLNTIELSAQSGDFEVFVASCDESIKSAKRHIKLDDYSAHNRAVGAFKYIFNIKNYRILLRALLEIKPDIIHVQNYLSRLSPSVLFALRKYRAKNPRARLIFTEHSYSPCANHCFYDFNKQRICEDCLRESAMKIAWRNCDRRGAIYSILKALRVPFYQGVILREQDLFDKVIFVSDFQRQKHLQAGYAREKTAILQNPIDLRFLNLDVRAKDKQNLITYYGRISEEKNIQTLIHAFAKLDMCEFSDYKLLIIGNGDELLKCKNLAQKMLKNKNYEFRAHLAPHELKRIIKASKIVVLPSKWYETFGLVILEAILGGAIPLASNIGALKESIERFCGFCFDLGECADSSDFLRAKMQEILINYEKNFGDFCERREEIIKNLKKQNYYDELKKIYLES